MKKISIVSTINGITVFVLLISIFSINQNAQAQSNTLYFMDKVHQADYLNPATQNCCNGFYSLPVISGIQANIVNSGFEYSHLIHLGTGKLSDSLIIDIDNLKKNLGNQNYVLADLSIPIFGLGFWARNSYLSFEITDKTKINVSYPKDIVELTGGNAKFIGENNPVIIDKFGPDMINYYEFAFGWSKKITHRLTIGAKLKLLSGLAAIQKKQSNIKIVTADTTYAMRLETDLNYNISAPVKFTYDKNGLISNIEFDDSKTKSDMMPNRNLGLALDFGAIYQLNDKVKLYGSITDLGFIRWGKYSNNIYQKGAFNYPGLSLDSVWSNSNYDEFAAWGDSIQEFFKFNHTEKKFVSVLNSNFYIGANYEVTSFLNFGLLSRTSLYNKSLHQAFTLSANLRPGKCFSTSLSYSIMNREYKNIGFGISERLGPFQLYLISDNIYTAFMPKKSKVVNLMFGFNMVFGCKKRDNFSMLNNNNPDKAVDFM